PDAFYVARIYLNSLVSADRGRIGEVNHYTIRTSQLECAGRERPVGADFDFDPILSAHNPYIANLGNTRCVPTGIRCLEGGVWRRTILRGSGCQCRVIFIARDVDAQLIMNFIEAGLSAGSNG